ncbi:alpha-tocopherol transfer protein-like [Anabrus simplex]|uniref:alpha-tocopherol transfer protein-like n=1 Tax=Anabrus simplex TaxID=316456 RepID=UPI0034DD21A6
MTPQLLLPPTPDIQKRIDKDLFRTRDKVEEDIRQLKQWLAVQPHLPTIDDDRFLERFLFGCKYSMERTKRVLDSYYTVRGAVPEFFSDRDPTASTMQQCAETLYYFPVPGHTPEGYRVNISALADCDVNKFSAKDYMKRMFLVADARLQEEASVGDVFVFDMRGFTLSHLVKFTLPLVKKLLICGQDAIPIRLKQFHLIYAPSFVDKVVALFKPYMKDKLANRIYIHSGDIDTLFRYIPKDILPNEYGGSAGTLYELNNAWRIKLESYRDWFIEEEKKRTDESKRPSKTRFASELFGMDGSFKKLSID